MNSETALYFTGVDSCRCGFEKKTLNLCFFLSCRLSTFMVSINNILFKYKVHQDTIDISYVEYNTFSVVWDASLKHVAD